VLSLPLFPTQDGPMHLYYTHVLRALLSGDSGIYARFYTVRHLLPPYALYYYALILLSHLVSPVVADKIITCLYFFCFAFGFRYLALSVGPRGGLLALLATPLLLNWSLGMGFLNFCLSAALVLWALGLWCRSRGTGDHWRKAGFVLLAYVVMLTHPVPLLILLAFCVVDSGLRWIIGRRHGASAAPPHRISDILYLGAAMGTLVYIKLFTTGVVTGQAEGTAHISFLRSVAVDMKMYVLQRSLCYFAGHTFADLATRIILGLVLIVPLLLGFHQRLRNRRLGLWTLGDTWLACSVVLSLALPLLPNEVNKAHYFAARLVIFPLIGALASASASTWNPASKSVSLERLIVVGAIAFNLLILATAEYRVRPVATDIARLETAPAPFTERVGILVPALDYERSATLSFNPYYWAGAAFFRRTDSVLLNSPWLVFSVMPLGATPSLPTSILAPSAMEQPEAFFTLLQTSSETRRIILPNASFSLVERGAVSASVLDPPSLPANSPTPWFSHCLSEGGDALCTKE